MKTLYHLIVNNVLAALANYGAWFSVTFFVYLETRSVFATGMIAGVFALFTMLSGFWFGSLVDHYPKKRVMLASTAASLALYLLALAVFLTAPEGAFADVANPSLWALVLLLVVGTVIGNLRSIALPTLVTVLVPEDRRAKANGLVGVGNGVGFGLVSVASGLIVGSYGMLGALAFSIALSVLAFAHLLFVRVAQDVAHSATHGEPRRVDLRGTIALVAGVPGLVALILFTTFNNFLGGSFMALLDAYGLSLMPVQAWGLLLGVLSFAFVAGGAVIAKYGLGKNPLRTMLFMNLFVWVVSALFTIQPSVILLAIGMFLWMAIGPNIEAAEQTVLQKVVPPERQGRVFGFAQSVEQAASPVTAFLMGPLAQFVFVPFMTAGFGAAAIGGWFGTGPDRGIALLFTLVGIVGAIVTLLAFRSRAYRLLSARYREG